MDVEELLAGLSDSESEAEITESLDSRAQLLLQSSSNDFSQFAEFDSVVSILCEKIRASIDPEISRLVHEPSQLAAVALLLGPDPTKTAEKDVYAHLESVVGKQTAMALRLYAFQPRDEPWQAEQSCQLVEQLVARKKTLLEDLSQQVETIAPNVLKLVSSATCTQLLGSLGGIKELATTSASNVQQRLKRFTDDPLFQGVSEQHLRSATRIVAGKLVLAARVDLSGADPDCVQGQKWRAYVQERLDKLGAAPPNKTDRALPVPQEAFSKRRGGKRVRKQKEKYAPSAQQLQAGRIAFGDTALQPARVGKAPSQLELSKKMRAELQKFG